MEKSDFSHCRFKVKVTLNLSNPTETRAQQSNWERMAVAEIITEIFPWRLLLLLLGSEPKIILFVLLMPDVEFQNYQNQWKFVKKSYRKGSRKGLGLVKCSVRFRYFWNGNIHIFYSQILSARSATFAYFIFYSSIFIYCILYFLAKKHYLILVRLVVCFWIGIQHQPKKHNRFSKLIKYSRPNVCNLDLFTYYTCTKTSVVLLI